MKKYAAISFLLGILWGCSTAPQPIEYGADACDFCRMTIVDNQHAAELVTQKGRVYKFDAIECMVRYLHQEDEAQFALFLVNDYLDPGVLIEAQNAAFLISRAIPSPMGANLSAFADEARAEAVRQEKEGRLYDWQELRRHFKEQGRGLH